MTLETTRTLLTRTERLASVNDHCDRHARYLRIMFAGSRIADQLSAALAANEAKRASSIALIEADYAPVAFTRLVGGCVVDDVRVAA